ncbi:MAG: N-acetyltransferase [Anaerolineales bacterium]|nr:MAG: N-acetyltransferase [Anaerolineales bacterium]
MSLVLETERLIMRAFQDKDILDFAWYRSDPYVAQYQGWDAPYSVEKAAEFVAENKVICPGTPGEWHQIALELKDGSQLIGDCVFHILKEDAQQAEIGFTLSRQYQGLGYATEAVTRLVDYLFGELQLHRICAICDVENQTSSKLLERIGMRREAHFVENIWFKGKWGSEYLYGLLQHEWAKSTS